MIGVGTAPFWLPWGQVWLQEFPLVVCQISSCHATSVPESWFCKHALAEGDMVATRWTARGTHQGELMGIPPSGNRVEVPGTTISRIEGGKVAEEWDNYDALGMMQAIGAVPEQEPAGS
jgi:SnoaL-like polyketide cyclase